RQADIVLSDALTDYQDGFRSAGIRPAAPERMIEWRRTVEDLFRQLREIDQIGDELDALKLKDGTLRPALLALADGIGLAAVALPTVASSRGLERLRVQVSQEWLDSRSSETKRVVGEEAIAGLEERERSLLEDIGLWQSKFSAAVQTVGLGEDADPAMALAALEAWRTVPDLLAER